MSLNLSHTTWNLTPLLTGDTDPRIPQFEKDVEAAALTFTNKWKERQDYLKDPLILKEVLDEYETFNRDFGTSGQIGYYFHLRITQEQDNPEVKAGFNKAHEFNVKIYNLIQFFELRLAAIPAKELSVFINHPALALYKHFLETLLANAPYLLSEPEEKILNLKALTSYTNWVNLTASFLGKEQQKVLLEDGTTALKSFEEILTLFQSQNKTVRDKAAKTFNTVLKKHIEIGEAEINSVLANKKTNDELRGLTRPDLSRHLSDDIETTVVDSLLDSVSQRFSLSHRFYHLKAQLLGQNQLEYHERNVNYGVLDKKYPYSEAVALVHSVFKKLDPQFATILEGYLEKGQLDVYPRASKRGGAFCSHDLITQPTYILLNHTDSLTDVLVLAHELGHGINNELIKAVQHSLYFGTPMATAEVASTFMEDYVLEEILLQANEEERLAIQMKKLNDDISTIFRQVACYRFEQELHESFRQKGFLTHQEIGVIFQKHMRSYMGDSVKQSPGSENWWLYWSHIRSFFYVYSYSSGLLISKSLQNSLKHDPTFIIKIKQFLAGGLSASPSTLFKELGIDITDTTFWDQGLAQVEALLEDTEKLAKKLGKISA